MQSHRAPASRAPARFLDHGADGRIVVGGLVDVAVSPSPTTILTSSPSAARADASAAPPGRRSDLVDGRREQAQRMFVQLSDLRPGTAEHQELRARLVEIHLPLVRYFARRYTGRNEPFDDLVQAGALGLVKTVDRFDPHRGVAFSTFAAPTILGEIRRHFRDRTWAVHVNRSLQVLTGEVATCRRDMSQQLGRAPSVAELADRMHLPPERIRESLQCSAAYRATSLATPVGSNGTLGDRLGAEDPGYDTVDTHETLGSALARLPARDRRVVQLRFYGNMSQAQIAARIGISQMHVSRLLNRTLSRLREDLVGAG
jgi:RNA polymerase sigma-B factor